MQQAARFTASSFTLWSSCTHNDCFAIAHARCWHDHNIVPKCPRCNAEIYSFNDIITGGHDWEEKQIRKLLEKGYTMRQIMQHVNHSITHRECADAALAYVEKKKQETRIKLRNKTYRALKKKYKYNVGDGLEECPPALYDVGNADADVQQAVRDLEQQERQEEDDLIIITYKNNQVCIHGSSLLIKNSIV